MADWHPAETAPYETPVISFWPGSDKLNPVMLINTKNSGAMLGKRDGWWFSKPDQIPTLWTHLPDAPTK